MFIRSVNVTDEAEPLNEPPTAILLVRLWVMFVVHQVLIAKLARFAEMVQLLIVHIVDRAVGASSCILAASTSSRWDFFPVHASSWWDSAVLGKHIEQTTPNLFSKNWLALTVPGAGYASLSSNHRPQSPPARAAARGGPAPPPFLTRKAQTSPDGRR